jgi:hypothetical protein
VKGSVRIRVRTFLRICMTVTTAPTLLDGHTVAIVAQPTVPASNAEGINIASTAFTNAFHLTPRASESLHYLFKHINVKHGCPLRRGLHRLAYAVNICRPKVRHATYKHSVCEQIFYRAMAKLAPLTTTHAFFKQRGPDSVE